MSVVRKLLDQLLSDSSNILPKQLQKFRQKANSLSLSEIKQFVREVSYILYKKQQSCSSQLFILQLLKQLMITGSFPIYLFLHVYIFPWVISINQLYSDRPLNKRAQLLYRDAANKTASSSSSNIQSYQELLQFASNFLVFFGQNLKFHPYSKYKIKSNLALQLANGSYSRSLDYFVQSDMQELRQNLRQYSELFRLHLSQLIQYLTEQVQQCLSNQTKYNEIAFFLLGLIEMSESYCITTIIYRLPSFITPQHLMSTCQLIHQIISVAQIEAIQLINIKCLPLILQFLLPVDFKSNMILPNVKYTHKSDILGTLIDYYYIWYDKTKVIGLSTKIYDYSYNLVHQLKKPAKLSYQKELQQFMLSINKMKNGNDMKRSFVTDQNLQTETRVVNLLKQVDFCVNSQRKQQIAFENVLDQLTLSSEDNKSDKMSDFSQSLLRSFDKKNLQNSNSSIKSNCLKGPPHKKFTNFDSSISTIKEKQSIQKKTQSFGLKNQQSINTVYYARDQSKVPTFYKKHQNNQNPIFNRKFRQSTKETSKIEQSFKYVHEPSPQLVSAKYNNTPHKSRIQSPQLSLSIHSSCFEQKQNNINGNQSQKGQQSGEFVHFQNNSLAKSQKERSIKQEIVLNNIDSDINFQDSLRLHQSHSQSLIEYGIDKNAKLPQTLNKPKFGFKTVDTNDSSLILKDMGISTHSPQTKQSKQTQNITPQKSIPILLFQLNNPQTHLNSIQNKNISNPNSSLKSSPFQYPPKQQGNGNTQLLVRPKIKEFKRSFNQSPKLETERAKSIYFDVIQSNKSSFIKQISAQPSLYSNSNSLRSQNVPSRFGSVFKRTKQEKASSLSSSRSLKQIRIGGLNQVQIPNLTKMRQLQNELGKIKAETQNMNKILMQKQAQMKKLKSTKKVLSQQDPYLLKKENEIMKKILKNRKNNQSILSSLGSAKLLSQELKTSSIKNVNGNLKDYNPDILKLKLQNIKGFTKQEKKNIVANRSLLLKNDLIQVGYSFKNEIVTLYITLKHYCDQLEINLVQNSVEYSESIQRQFDKVLIGKQIKFKTEVKKTKDENIFIPSVLKIRLQYQQKFNKKIQNFQQELPLTPYNLAKGVPESGSNLTQTIPKDQITHYITPLYNSCNDLIKKGKQYLQYLFPLGVYDDSNNTFSINFQWKQKIEKIKVKLKERVFRIEGIGNPLQSGRQLIQAVINMLTASSINN